MSDTRHSRSKSIAAFLFAISIEARMSRRQLRITVRNLLLTPTLVVALTSGCSGPDATPSADSAANVVVMSFNIRYDNPDDGIHAWPNRRDRVAKLIRFHGAEIAALQEAQLNQINDLVARLPEYGWYGVGRDDGRAAGEFVPIFYRSDRYAVADSGTFWLSPEPERPGPPAWDAAITRIVSWVRLTQHESGRHLYVFNAHLDHVGERAREESSQLIVDRLAGQITGEPFVLLGDFNAEPDSRVHAILTSDSTRVRMRDAFEVAEITYGPGATFYGFQVDDSLGRRIDYVFVSSGAGVGRYGVLTDQIEGRYPSDHLPVLVELEL